MENYEYSRRQIAKTTEDVRFASNRRRLLYAAGGLVVVVIFLLFSRKFQTMSDDALRLFLFDWLFLGGTFLICIWFSANVMKALDQIDKNEKKDFGEDPK